MITALIGFTVMLLGFFLGVPLGIVLFTVGFFGFALIHPAGITAAMAMAHITAVLLGQSWLSGFAWLFGFALGLQIFHVLGGLRAASAGRGDFVVLASVPKYALWKIRLYWTAIMRGDDRRWIRTERSDRLAQ